LTRCGPNCPRRRSRSSIDPTPLFAFGHGLSYTSFEYANLVIGPDRPEQIATHGTVEIS
jgi:beta-xylosidase